MLKIKKNQSLSRKKFRGLSLIEAMLFLGLAAFVGLGIYGYYSTSNNTAKLNQAQSQVQSYVSGVKTLYGSQDSYSTVNNAVIIGTKKAPANAVRGTTGLRHPWGGATVITGAADYFEVSMAGLTADSCTSLLAANILDNGTIFRITANSTIFQDSNNPDPATAMAACNSATNNTVTFRAR